MNLKNKYLFIFCLFLVIVCSSNFVFADFTFDYNNSSITLPDIPSDIDISYGYFVGYYQGYFIWVLNNENSYFWHENVNVEGSASCYVLEDNVWVSNGDTRSDACLTMADCFRASSVDIYSDINKTSVLHYKNNSLPTLNSFVNPYIANTVEDLETGNFGNLLILLGDYDLTSNNLYLHILKKYENVSSDIPKYYQDTVMSLGLNSSYIFTEGSSYYFDIPIDKLPVTFVNGQEYVFALSSIASDLGSLQDFNISDVLSYKSFVVGGLTEEEKEQIYQDKITGSLEENNKTSKSILEKIVGIFNFLNPFHEDFFGKKLVELILDGIKSLFIPEDGFFEEYFTNLKDWFSDRLGFLFYPFELIIDILNKMLNINFSEPIFNIPDIKEPFTGAVFISATTFNLNSLLSNSVFENVHNIYLILVDSIIVIGLVNLARRKFEEVTRN